MTLSPVINLQAPTFSEARGHIQVTDYGSEYTVGQRTKSAQPYGQKKTTKTLLMERQEQDKKPMQKPFLAKGGTLASNGAAVKKLQELKKKREEFLHNKGKAGMDELKSFPRSKKTGLFSD